MEIKFIGTGSGKTTLKRYHSSFLINTEKYNLLVDAGDGISRALLHQKVTFDLINGILISHLHPDHYSGLPSLIIQMKLTERQESLDIFCHESHFDFLIKFLSQSYIFQETLGFKLNFKSFEQKKTIDISEGFSFIASQNSHLKHNENLDRSGILSFTCNSFLIRVKEKNIFFTGDIGDFSDLFLFEDQKIAIMISEITHISIEELFESFRRLRPEKLFITHLGEEDEEKVSRLSYQLPSAERRKVIAAFDGLNVKI
jgi:ribonuclease BN (tRNA processing enzyme)